MKRDLILLSTAVAGPAVWFLSFGSRFALVPLACASHSKPALYVISLIALLVAAGSGAVAYRQWRYLGLEPAGEGGGSEPRSRSLAIGGLFLNLASCLLIVAQAIVEISLGACE